MANYSITNKAIDDLSMIWSYSYDTLSENQADKYYLELLSDCKVLFENQHLGKNYKDIDQDTFGYKSGRHIIFYRKLSGSQITILRFLHSRMDLKNKLEE